MTDFGPNPGSRVGRKKSTGGGSSSITIGTTPIVGGTTTRILYDNAAKVGELATTGSGNVVLATSATLVTPALGTPSALVLTNATALPAAQVAVGALANGITATTQSPSDNSTKIATTAYTDAAVAAIPGAAYLTEPGGRLSLTSAVAVQTADVVGGTHIYYVPYVHDQLPVVGLTLGTGVNLALDAATPSQASGKLYDLFLFNHSGTLVLGTGAAWTNSTTRNQAIDQTTVAGIWTNTGTITLTYDATPHTVSCTAGKGLYVGTMYASANGQCTVQFNPAAAAGGANTIVGLFNAYNRIMTLARSQDSTGSWTYNSSTWRKANNSASNRVSWVDGLGVTFVQAKYICNMAPGTGDIGVLFNATTGTPGVYGDWSGGTTHYGGATPFDQLPPILGFNYVQAAESNASGLGGTWYGSGQYQALGIMLEV